MDKLVVVIMGQNCEKFIEMCLESVKEADSIWYLDGGSVDNTMKIVKDFLNEYRCGGYLFNQYNQEDIGMNGKQRGFYLNYLKQNYIGWWCLCLDCDEILEDFGIQKIQQVIQNLQPMILSPRIHHFIGDLGHEDATKEQHFVPNRLFCITEDLTYPEVEHPVLQGKAQQGIIDVHIWHLRECLGVFETRKKHLNNWKKSNMHSKQYLNFWNNSMLLGNYPRKPVYFGSIPQVIKNHFYLYQDAN